MRVLYFGTYERDYPRNAQVISCLRGAGVEVAERHVSVWEGREHKFAAGAAAAARLALAELRLAARRPEGSFDALIVGYPGHLDLPAARRAARGRPVVLNPLVSLADTLVEDRGRFRRGSLPARVLAGSTAPRSGPPTSSSRTPRRTRSCFARSAPAASRSASSAPRSACSGPAGPVADRSSSSAS